MSVELLFFTDSGEARFNGFTDGLLAYEVHKTPNRNYIYDSVDKRLRDLDSSRHASSNRPSHVPCRPRGEILLPNNLFFPKLLRCDNLLKEKGVSKSPWRCAVASFIVVLVWGRSDFIRACQAQCVTKVISRPRITFHSPTRLR